MLRTSGLERDAAASPGASRVATPAVRQARVPVPCVDGGDRYAASLSVTDEPPAHLRACRTHTRIARIVPPPSANPCSVLFQISRDVDNARAAKGRARFTARSLSGLLPSSPPPF